MDTLCAPCFSNSYWAYDRGFANPSGSLIALPAYDLPCSPFCLTTWITFVFRKMGFSGIAHPVNASRQDSPRFLPLANSITHFDEYLVVHIAGSY